MCLAVSCKNIFIELEFGLCKKFLETKLSEISETKQSNVYYYYRLIKKILLWQQPPLFRSLLKMTQRYLPIWKFVLSSCILNVIFEYYLHWVFAINILYYFKFIFYRKKNRKISWFINRNKFAPQTQKNIIYINILPGRLCMYT